MSLEHSPIHQSLVGRWRKEPWNCVAALMIKEVENLIRGNRFIFLRRRQQSAVEQQGEEPAVWRCWWQLLSCCVPGAGSA